MKRFVILAFAGLILLAARGVAAPTVAPDAEKEGTISGVAQKRDQGGWIGVELKDHSFRVTFYNEKKKPVAADKFRAVLRWAVHYQPNAERAELMPTDDPAVLSSPYPVKPPYTFKLHVTLLSEGKEDVETYTIDFSA